MLHSCCRPPSRLQPRATTYNGVSSTRTLDFAATRLNARGCVSLSPSTSATIPDERTISGFRPVLHRALLFVPPPRMGISGGKPYGSSPGSPRAVDRGSYRAVVRGPGRGARASPLRELRQQPYRPAFTNVCGTVPLVRAAGWGPGPREALRRRVRRPPGATIQGSRF